MNINKCNLNISLPFGYGLLFSYYNDFLYALSKIRLYKIRLKCVLLTKRVRKSSITTNKMERLQYYNIMLATPIKIQRGPRSQLNYNLFATHVPF